MKYRLTQLILLLIFCTDGLYSNTVCIISWNIRDFGQSRDEIEIYNIATLLKDADLVAIQEVVALHPGGVQAVARLVDQLKRMGSNWDYSISDPTRSPSNFISERYAYLWKPSKLKMIGHPRLLSELSEIVHREPFLGHFYAEGIDFSVLNYHSRTHHVSSNEEVVEFNEINRWISHKNLENVIWLGDFNLESNNAAYDAFSANGFKQTFINQKTTLKKSCVNGNYLSLGEDNIFIKSFKIKYYKAAVIDFINTNCNDLLELSKSYSSNYRARLTDSNRRRRNTAR